MSTDDFPPNHEPNSNEPSSTDDALGAMLRSRGVPAHGPDFWSSVEQAIDGDAPQLVVLPKIGPVHEVATDPDQPRPGAAVSDGPLPAALPPAKVIPLSQPRTASTKSRSGRGAWVAIAAAVAVVLGAAATMFAGARSAPSAVDVVAYDYRPTAIPVPFDGTAPPAPPTGYFDQQSGYAVNDMFAYAHTVPEGWTAEPYSAGTGLRFESPDGTSRLHVHAQQLAPGSPPVVPLIPGPTQFSESQIPVVEGIAGAFGPEVGNQVGDVLASINVGTRNGMTVSQMVAEWTTDDGLALAVVAELESVGDSGPPIDSVSLVLFTASTVSTVGQYPPLLPTANVAGGAQQFDQPVPEPTAPAIFIPVDTAGTTQLMAQLGNLYHTRGGEQVLLIPDFYQRFDETSSEPLVQRSLLDLVTIGGRRHLLVREFTSGPTAEDGLRDKLLTIDLSTDQIRVVEDRFMPEVESVDWFYNGYVTTDGTDLYVERSFWQGACGWIDKISLDGQLLRWPENPVPRPDLTALTDSEVSELWARGGIPDRCVPRIDAAELLSPDDSRRELDLVRELQMTLQDQAR